MGYGEKNNPNSTWYKKHHGGLTPQLAGVRYISESDLKKSFWQRIIAFFKRWF